MTKQPSIRSNQNAKVKAVIGAFWDSNGYDLYMSANDTKNRQDSKKDNLFLDYLMLHSSSYLSQEISGMKLGWCLDI